MGAGASAEGVTVCAEGDRVKANFKGKGSWYNGSITRCNDNGTYEITYDDGDTESEVRSLNIRSLIERASPRKSPGKSPTKDGGDGLNIPVNLAPRLHRFWALMVQGLQCKAWRVKGSDVNVQTLSDVEETNEVLWLLAQGVEPILTVGPQKTQKPNSGMLLFPLASLKAPSRVAMEDGELSHPVFQLQNETHTVVVGVDTEKSANMLVQLIGEVLDSISGKEISPGDGSPTGGSHAADPSAGPETNTPEKLT